MVHFTTLLLAAGAIVGATTAADEACTPSSCEEAATEPDTSLLQHKLQVQPAGGHQAAGPGVLPDVPEASWAWALWQKIDGVADPYKLANSTALELPGSVFPQEPTVLNALAKGLGLGYSAPRGVTPDSEAWVVDCLGHDYKLTPVSSWTLMYVTMPQIVPFVVPMDQPERTDVSIILAPGGGGQVLDWEIEGTDIAKSFNRLGISAFVLKYRVPMSVWGPAAEIMDAQRALALVRFYAPVLGLNASRVGMFGASHGGFTSTFTSYAAKRLYPWRDAADDLNLKPDFWILLYPQLEVEVFAKAAAGPMDLNGIEMNGLSSTPPTFIAAGENDGCCKVETMYAFHELIKLHANAPVEINVFSDIGHYWATCIRRGKDIMNHEACLWILRARHFIMWNIEHKVPSEIDLVYQETVKYINPLLVRNVSG